LLVSVREGSSPLEGAEVSLRVESGAGKLTEAVVITGPGGAAVTGLASGSEGQVVVSAALTGGETSVACGQLELRFGAAHFPVVQTDLVRVFR
jgi:hypothetical protein